MKICLWGGQWNISTDCFTILVTFHTLFFHTRFIHIYYSAFSFLIFSNLLYYIYISKFYLIYWNFISRILFFTRDHGARLFKFPHLVSFLFHLLLILILIFINFLLLLLFFFLNIITATLSRRRKCEKTQALHVILYALMQCVY